MGVTGCLVEEAEAKIMREKEQKEQSEEQIENIYLDLKGKSWPVVHGNKTDVP